MPNAQDPTARDLAGQLITFMETGTPPDGLSPRTSSATSPCRSGDWSRRARALHPALGDAATMIVTVAKTLAQR